MSYSTRIIVVNTLLIFVMIIAFATLFYVNQYKELEAVAQKNLQFLAEKTLHQFDTLIQPMEFVSEQLISNPDFRYAMEILSTLDAQNPEHILYTNEASRTISSQLRTYPITKNFTSVNVFNAKGDFQTSNIYGYYHKTPFSQRIKEIPWLSLADQKKGRLSILSPYQNPWNKKEKELVFSIVRSIQGGISPLGYIEVQKSYTELESTFKASRDKAIFSFVFNDNNHLFYQNMFLSESEDHPKFLKHTLFYQSFLNQPPKEQFLQHPDTGESLLIARAKSPISGMQIILVQPQTSLMKSLFSIRQFIVLTGLFALLISSIINACLVSRISQPLKILKNQIEQINLADLSHPITSIGHVKYSAAPKKPDEIQLIYLAFSQLQNRLADSMDREIKFQQLHLQASFDSLQAQINPHFIYNILNVLSNRGLENHDETICNICQSIASMLRYSTSTLQRMATIYDEFIHLSTYLQLMASRYEDQLSYSIDIDPSIFSQEIPKIVLQQIVENSFHYGYNQDQPVLDIQIKGYHQKENWVIEIQDNGPGFSPSVLENLQQSFKQTQENLSNQTFDKGYTIGGMGLVNTYARLFLAFQNKMDFRLKNIKTHQQIEGAQIIITSLFDPGKESL